MESLSNIKIKILNKEIASIIIDESKTYNSLSFRNLGDLMYSNNYKWLVTIDGIKLSSKIFLTMAMAAIGLSTNLKEIKNMGYKPFVVGFISMTTVGLVSITTIELYLYYLMNFLSFQTMKSK